MAGQGAMGSDMQREPSGLLWIRREIDENLRQTRLLLEDFAEGETRDLGAAITALHQVWGALLVAQVHGGAMLADELERLARALHEQAVADPEGAAESLMVGIAQLPAYLERVEGGQPDIPLVLMPLMNELRAARAAPPVSETGLFAPRLAAQLEAEPVRPGSGNPELPRRAARLRREYHLGLLRWLREQQPDAAIKSLRGVIDQLASLAGTERMRRLLDAADALLLAASDGEVEHSAAVKRLYGRLDRVIKRLIAAGEETVASDFPIALYREFLYHIARSTSRDPVIEAVRKAADLANSFPEDAAADPGDPLGAGRELFEQVAAEMASDLADIKDRLDIYMRGERSELGRIEALAEPIRRMADTLGMVGQGRLRERLVPHADGIREAVDAGVAPDEERLMQLAWDLLAVESALHSLGDAEAPAETSGTPDLSEGEYRQHLGAALEQALVELAHVREALGEYLALEQLDSLRKVPSRLHALGGALAVVNQPAVGELLQGLEGYVRALLEGERPHPPLEEQERLGELVSGIEVYLGSLLQPTPQTLRALDMAREAADSLALPSVEPEASVEAATSEAQPAAEAGEAPAAAGELDSEILPIFIEEAREALETLRERLPAWVRAPEDGEALAEVRRAFHTLKGSGRLVGALEIGEFAWAMENMLNRVIDGTVASSPEMFALLEEAVEALPALIDAREQGIAAEIDPLPLQARADALAAGEPLPAAEAPEAATEPEPEIPAPEPEEAEPDLELDLEALEPEPASPALASDEEDTEPLLLDLDEEGTAPDEAVVTELPVSALQEDESILTPASEESAPIQLEPTLHEIFAREAAGHLRVVEHFVDRCRGLANGCPYDEELRRALHTLRGSANMAGVEPIAELAGALERWANLQAGLGRRTDQLGIDLLERGHFVLQALREVINVPGASLPSWESLAREVRQACRDLEQQAAGEEETESRLAGAEGADEELAGIFAEEARELLESLEEAQGQWQARPDDLLPVAQMQRALHTLKGGARLAGLEALGDLGHAMESLFEAVVEQRIDSATPGLQRLARHAIDTLASQVERLEQGAQVAVAEELVEALQRAARGESWVLPQAEDSVSASLELASAAVGGDSSELLGDAELESLEHSTSVMEPSTLLGDSQLLTDSELLSEASELVATSSALVPGDGDVSGLHSDSRIIQFPARGRHAEEAADEPPRRPPPPPEEEKKPASRERVRVRGELLDQMINNAGEVSIYRARLEQQNRLLAHNLDELTQTIGRLRRQLRQLENETEAQILARHEREHEGALPAGFDPLEMDRYSTIQQLSRALAETTDDLGNLGGTLGDINRDTETLLQQQERIVNDLQDGLLRTRMVPIGSRASRLQRVVRQTAQSLGKQAELTITGAAGEMDRVILERMMAPLEHLFRNAVVHGIEPPEARRAAGKPPVGQVSLAFEREGPDVVLEVADDGRGLDREAIRRKAIERGLIDAEAHVEGEDLDAFILEAGLSTSEEVTQVAGRGVGMDVVVNEIKQLGGTLEIASEPGQGTRFRIRLPFTLAITEALLVQAGEAVYAVPHGGMEGIARIARGELEACYRGERSGFGYGGREYAVRYLGRLLGTGAPQLPEGERWLPLLLVRAGEHHLAIQVDRLLGNRQIVVKSVGTQLASVRWFTGGTILADGSIALILDTGALVRMDSAQQAPPEPELQPAAERRGVKVMVVDDSVTVRKVTSRLLQRHNMEVITARDGVDAVTLLQEERPDVMLLDIEMPRMDGFELARHMRSTEELRDIPIIMITSRTGDKHREHARELGVRRYLGKPYQESELLDNIYTVLAEVTP